jgi:hypothetical protein
MDCSFEGEKVAREAKLLCLENKILMLTLIISCSHEVLLLQLSKHHCPSVLNDY